RRAAGPRGGAGDGGVRAAALPHRRGLDRNPDPARDEGLVALQRDRPGHLEARFGDASGRGGSQARGAVRAEAGNGASSARRRPERINETNESMKQLFKNERGTAVVEFAVIALPLCLIIFGILDFGRALNYYNDVTQLAGQGARAAAVNENVDG